MKIFITIGFILSVLVSCAKTAENRLCFIDSNSIPYPDTIRISVLGHSHLQNYGSDFTSSNDFFHAEFRTYLENQIGLPVKLFIHSRAARGIGASDPRKLVRPWAWQSYEVDSDIMTVLANKPNLVVVMYNSNEIANSMPVDTIIDCYRVVIDSIKAAGAAYILVDGFARGEKLGAMPFPPSGLHLDRQIMYHERSLAVINWMQNNHVGKVANFYNLVYDTVRKYYPKETVLDNDRLHYKKLGQQLTTQALINTDKTQAFINNFAPEADNFVIKKTSEKVSISLNFKGQLIKIAGSNDGSIFTYIKTYNFFNLKKTSVNIELQNNYQHYRIELFNRTKILTLLR